MNSLQNESCTKSEPHKELCFGIFLLDISVCLIFHLQLLHVNRNISTNICPCPVAIFSTNHSTKVYWPNTLKLILLTVDSSWEFSWCENAAFKLEVHASKSESSWWLDYNGYEWDYFLSFTTSFESFSIP